MFGRSGLLSGQRSGMLKGLDFLNDPSVALPVAAALMSGQNNQDAFARGFATLGDARTSARERQREQEQRNLTLEYLRGKSPDIAEQVAAGMPVSEAWRMHNKMKTAQAGGTEYGLRPIYGEDAEGNTIIGTLGKDGSFKQIQMPEQFQPSSGVDRVDAGDHFILLNKRTGEAVGSIPKNIAEVEKQKVLGKSEGEKVAGSEQAIAQAEEMLAVIQDVKSDPGRIAGTGASSYLWNALPGALGSRDFAAKVEQLRGKAFLQAFESLKGGGQITEREGLAAQNAIARLDTAQSEEGFLQALNDLEGVVNRGLARARGEKIPELGETAGSGNDPLGIR